MDHANAEAQNIDGTSRSENIHTESLLQNTDESLEAAAEMNQYFYNNLCLSLDPEVEEEHIPKFQGPCPGISPPLEALLGPKYALWDCPRPAQGSDWFQDYCINFCGIVDLNEGPPGMGSVL